jgi:hypothetical protein
MSESKLLMSSYLVLFTGTMIDINQKAIREWLNRLGSEGKLVSVDKLTGPLPAYNRALIKSEFKGFVIINARDHSELNAILQACPSLNLNELGVYELT